jgi:hypothetical protein
MIDARDVDRVFATGGSSLVSAVRGRLAARLIGGEELTSVAWGLTYKTAASSLVSGTGNGVTTSSLVAEKADAQPVRAEILRTHCVVA